MFTFNVDLGQLIISCLIGVVGWFINRTLRSLEARIDRHDKALAEVTGTVQFILGLVDRRKRELDNV